MELEWDEAKRAANFVKHGLDFADVASLDWNDATIIEDNRFAYPEPRFWAFAKGNGRYHVVTFRRRGRKTRIVSFRKANDREVRRHGK
jgi:uncharacterized DUF497 family protein